MPQMYLELLENKEKTKPDIVNKPYVVPTNIPASELNPPQPPPPTPRAAPAEPAASKWSVPVSMRLTELVNQYSQGERAGTAYTSTGEGKRQRSSGASSSASSRVMGLDDDDASSSDRSSSAATVSSHESFHVRDATPVPWQLQQQTHDRSNGTRQSLSKSVRSGGSNSSSGSSHGRYEGQQYSKPYSQGERVGTEYNNTSRYETQQQSAYGMQYAYSSPEPVRAPRRNVDSMRPPDRSSRPAEDEGGNWRVPQQAPVDYYGTAGAAAAVPTQLPSLEDLNIRMGKTYANAEGMEDKSNEDDLKRELLFRFDLLKKNYPNLDVPDVSVYSDYRTMKHTYDGLLKSASFDANVSSLKQYMVYGFHAIEFTLGRYFGFDMDGFARSEVASLQKYNRTLLELGEKSYLEETTHIPVEIRLFGMMAMQAVLFIAMRTMMNKSGANNLMDMYNAAMAVSGDAQHPASAPAPSRPMRGPKVDISQFASIPA